MEIKMELELAKKAMAEYWPECYSSPSDMSDTMPPGTVEECSDEHGSWERVWCEDGTARMIMERQ